MRQRGGDIGEKAQSALTAVGEGVLDATKAVGKITSSTADAAASAANTGKILVDVTGETAIGVGKNTGKALTAAAGTAAKTVETVENLSARLENYTKEAQKQAQIANETATFETQNAQKANMANSDATTQTKLQQIEADKQKKLQKITFDLEREQKETAAEQERMLAELNANQTQAYLDTTENINKQKKAYYYGFTNNNPGSNDTGYKPKFFSFGKWCYSYIPKTFVKANNAGNIGIIFPEELPRGTRPYFISAINRDTGQPITISFKTINYIWARQTYMKDVPVIKYKDEQNNDVELEGTIYYHEMTFLCPTTIRGGKRSRTNKRRRTYRRSRTNKRRTNRRRTNRRSNKRSRRL